MIHAVTSLVAVSSATAKAAVSAIKDTFSKILYATHVIQDAVNAIHKMATVSLVPITGRLSSAVAFDIFARSFTYLYY